MTRDEAKGIVKNFNEVKGVAKNFEVVKAFAEGKTVQYRRHTGGWYSADNPTFDWRLKWRVKPEPIRVKLLVFEDGTVVSPKGFLPTSPHRLAEFVEVTN